MANISFTFSIPDKNLKAVMEYFDSDSALNLTIGRRTTTLTDKEAYELYAWLGARLENKTTLANTDKVLETLQASKPVDEDTVATEARKGLIDMSSKLTSPKKIIVKTS